MTSEITEKKENINAFAEEGEETAHADSRKYLTFFSDDQGFAINSKYVIEIINEFSITHLPCVPNFIKGIINLRGQIIPIMDMRLRLGRMEAEYSREACIVVIAVNAISIGLFVDRVSQMTDIEDDQLSATPESHQEEFVKGIGRIDQEVYLMLDCERLLTNI